MNPLEIDIKKLSDDIEHFILETEKNVRSTFTTRPYIDELKKIILKHFFGKTF